MQRIVFLDIDGVITTRQSYKRAEAKLGKAVDTSTAFKAIDRHMLKRVERLCVAARASIVLSTSWRLFFETDGIVAGLRRLGLATTPVIDITPRSLPTKMSGAIPRNYRTLEIERWLDTNVAVEYVILEDEHLTSGALRARQVRTSMLEGFTAKHLTEALALFGIDNKRRRYKHKPGELIVLNWDTDMPEFYAVHGHVSDEEVRRAWDEYFESPNYMQTRPVKRTWARWSCEGDSDQRLGLGLCDGPGRGRFPVTAILL